ncbi:MAG: prepilin peptidase [Eubacterium sp.]|nr:prepilin peptidase [Eubacterium sp.]
MNAELMINMKDVIYNGLVGIVIWLVTTFLISKYYETRFEEKMIERKRDVVTGVLSGVLTAAVMGLFTIYGYTLLHSVSLIILLSALIGISRIDKKHRIIPSRILLVLFMIRVLTIGGEIFIDKADVMVIVLSSVLGIVYGSVIFLVIRLFSKDSIGMGDIKLFSVIGFYIGSTAILPAMFITSIFALVYGVVMIARKAISKKDTMSFGPFIAAGTIVTMILGI